MRLAWSPAASLGRLCLGPAPWALSAPRLGLAGLLLGGVLGVLLLREDLPYHFFAVDTWAAAILGSIVIIAGYQALHRAR